MIRPQVAQIAPPNLGLAWKRLYAMVKPMDDAKRQKIAVYQVLSLACWPVIAVFGKYTMEMDYPEHTARHVLADKKYSYMKNPANIPYAWQTPCTMFDFECAYKHRKETGLDKGLP